MEEAVLPSTIEHELALTCAIAAHQAGDILKAEELYQGLLQASPTDPDALHFLGLLRVQRRPVEAEHLIHKSLESAPRNPHAWNNLGNLLFATGRHAAAADAYIRAVDLDITLAAPWKNLGECLERAGSPERAIQLFQHIIETVPGFIPAYEALGRLLRVLGKHAEAVKVYRRWVELEPDRPSARHLLAAVTGQDVPERASDAYMRELFDGFAEDFDDKLTRLKYRAPDLFCSMLSCSLPAAVVGTLQILDAGCGTGLCVPYLRPLAAELIGVDLSEAMLHKAQVRGGYDRLHQAELTTYMNASPNRFDTVVCVDTLCYFGPLNGVFAAARGTLRPGGLLAFSLEQLVGPHACEPYRIEHHGRYQHSRPYVESALAAEGFALVEFKEAVLRQEVFAGVPGLVVLAAAPSSRG